MEGAGLEGKPPNGRYFRFSGCRFYTVPEFGELDPDLFWRIALRTEEKVIKVESISYYIGLSTRA